MAATGTPTPNIGLRIPLGTDPASVDDINYNSNLIDTKLGAVGNDSVQDQIDDLNSNIYKTITNGNVVGGHSYLLTLKETSLADAYFEILYSADVNNGVKVFSTVIMLSNKLYACTGKITLSNGTISITDAYRQALDASSANDLSVSIQAIRQIA